MAAARRRRRRRPYGAPCRATRRPAQARRPLVDDEMVYIARSPRSAASAGACALRRRARTLAQPCRRSREPCSSRSCVSPSTRRPTIKVATGHARAVRIPTFLPPFYNVFYICVKFSAENFVEMFCVHFDIGKYVINIFSSIIDFPN